MITQEMIKDTVQCNGCRYVDMALIVILLIATGYVIYLWKFKK
jgi:hypothetical protein